MEGLVMSHQNQMAATTGLRKEGKGRAWPRESLEAKQCCLYYHSHPFLGASQGFEGLGFHDVLSL